MNPKRILVLGGGFAGLWAAAGAARKLDELGVGPQEVAVTLVNRDPYHSIRVRNYEADLTPTRVPLCEVLDPIGVTFVEGEVRGFDFADRQARVATAVGETSLPYDRLVVALGTPCRRYGQQLHDRGHHCGRRRPPLPRLRVGELHERHQLGRQTHRDPRRGGAGD